MFYGRNVNLTSLYYTCSSRLGGSSLDFSSFYVTITIDRSVFLAYSTFCLVDFLLLFCEMRVLVLDLATLDDCWLC